MLRKLSKERPIIEVRVELSLVLCVTFISIYVVQRVLFCWTKAASKLANYFFEEIWTIWTHLSSGWQTIIRKSFKTEGKNLACDEDQ